MIRISDGKNGALRKGQVLSMLARACRARTHGRSTLTIATLAKITWLETLGVMTTAPHRSTIDLRRYSTRSVSFNIVAITYGVGTGGSLDIIQVGGDNPGAGSGVGGTAQPFR
eukprot:4753627-Pyramimonas_sp.AAC.1